MGVPSKKNDTRRPSGPVPWLAGMLSRGYSRAKSMDLAFAARELQRKTWNLFGATPILCSYVASMPICKTKLLQDNRAQGPIVVESTCWQDTPWFTFPVALGGVAWGLFLVAKKRYRLLDFLHVPRPWKLGIRAYASASQLTAAAFLFLLFCQRRDSRDFDDGNAQWRTKISGLRFSEMETYSEHVFTLALLAACRLAASSFNMDSMAACDHHDDQIESGASRQEAGATWLWVLDTALSISSPVVFLLACITISGGNKIADSCVDANTGQQWMQWMTFNLLAYPYFLQGAYTLFGSGFFDAVSRAAIIALGCTAFHYRLPATAEHSMPPTPRVNFHAIKAWADDGGLGIKVMLQIWAALLAARWFVALSRNIIERLSPAGLNLDIHGKHAADADDICFSLATACLFAASYASSPLHQAESSSPSSPSNPLPLLLVLGSAAAGVAGAVVLHWFVGLVKQKSGTQT